MQYKTRTVWSATHRLNLLGRKIKEIKETIRKLEISKRREIEQTMAKLEKSRERDIVILKKKIAELERENLVLRINDHLNIKFLRKREKVNFIKIKCPK